MIRVRIWTDGSITKNPGGAGGWAFIARIPGVDLPATNSGRLAPAPSVTNNRMEMLAVIEALVFVKRSVKPEVEVVIATDSRYVQGNIEHLARWRGQGWQRKEKDVGLVDVKNRDLWERLEALLDPERIQIVHVRGHAGDEENEAADKLAGIEARTALAEKAAVEPDPMSDEEVGIAREGVPICTCCGRPL